MRDGEGLINYSFFNCFINKLTNAFKIIFNISVGKSNNFYIILLKHFASNIIIRFSFFCVMLRTVNFYNKFCFMTIEICNIRIDDTLFIYFNWIMLQIIIP